MKNSLTVRLTLIVIWCTCTWPASPVSAFLFEDIGEIQPEDPYFLENDTLVLTCSLTGYQGGLDAEFMFFEYKMTGQSDFIAVPEEYQEIVSDTSIRMTWPMIQTEDSGYYYCRVNESSIGRSQRQTIAQTDVIVTTPPEPITELTCVSDNNYDMTCSWCDQVQDGVSYELQWTVSSVMAGDCPNPSYHPQTYVLCGCKFCQNVTRQGDCEGKNQTFFPPTTCKLNITSRKVNRFQVSSVVAVNTSFTAIVKPRPPQTLIVSNIESRSATVHWTPPPNLGGDLFPLEYNVTYWSTRTESRPRTEMTTSLSLELEDLHPYDDYTVQVSARPDPDGIYISDPATAVFKSEQDAPAAAPALAKGSFKPVKNSDPNDRTLYIYWQEIPEEHRNGEIRYYVVRAKDLSDNTEQTFDEVIPDKYYKTIELREDRAYNVSVAAHTEAGEGPRAWLHLPAVPQVLPQPAHLDGVINDTSVLFTIVPPEGVNVTDYTLFWCQSINRNQHCEGPAHSMTLDGEALEYRLDGYATFNVYSLAVNSAESTSGLAQQWLCLYDLGGDPGPVKFEFDAAQQERALTIRWEHLQCDDIAVRGKVSIYNIYINASTGQVPETIPVINDQLDYSLRIEDLEPYTLYHIEMEACTQVTCGEMTSDTRKTVESAPGDAPSSCLARVLNSSTIEVTWEPPVLPNGVISKYHILVNTSDHSVTREVAGDMRVAAVEGLHGYVNYSVRVLAENGAGHSPVSQPSFALTPIRAPAAVSFSVEVFSNDTMFVSWSAPVPPNGPISYYNATFARSEDRKPAVQTKTVNSTAIFVTTDCSYGPQQINVSVIAANVDARGKHHASPAAKVETVETCAGNAELPLNVLVSIGVLVPLLFVGLLIVVFCLLKKCCHHEAIKIKLPDDLDSTIHVTGSCDKVDHYADIEEGLNTNLSSNGDCTKLKSGSNIENHVLDNDSGLSSGSSRGGSLSSKSSGQASNTEEKNNPFSSGESEDIETYTKVAKNGSSSGGPADPQRIDEIELEEVIGEPTQSSGRRDSAPNSESLSAPLRDLSSDSKSENLAALSPSDSAQCSNHQVPLRQDSCRSDIENYTKGTDNVVVPQGAWDPAPPSSTELPPADSFAVSPGAGDPLHLFEPAPLLTTLDFGDGTPVLVIDSFVGQESDSECDFNEEQSSGESAKNTDAGIYRQGSEEVRHQEVFVPDGPAAPIRRDEATC